MTVVPQGNRYTLPKCQSDPLSLIALLFCFLLPALSATVLPAPFPVCCILHTEMLRSLVACIPQVGYSWIKGIFKIHPLKLAGERSKTSKTVYFFI